MSKHLWASARILVFLSLAVLTADSLYLGAWFRSTNSSAGYVWASYAATALLHLSALAALAKGGAYPRPTGALLIAFGAGAFFLMGASVYHLIIKPESMLLAAAGVLCLLCAPATGKTTV